MKGEALRHAILEYLFEYGVDSITQEKILESLRQKFVVEDVDFINAIRTLSDQEYILDEVSRCRLQPKGILEVEKLKGLTPDHQKISESREQHSLNINRGLLISTIISAVITIIVSVTDYKIPVKQVLFNTEEIAKNFYTCKEENCTKENDIQVFDAGIEYVNMTWHYQNILPGSTFAREWKLEEENGKTWVRYECQWPTNKPITGSVDFVMKEPKGLPAGTWVLTIWVNGTRMLEERVEIVGVGGEFDVVPGIKTDCFDTIDSHFN